MTTAAAADNKIIHFLSISSSVSFHSFETIQNCLFTSIFCTLSSIGRWWLHTMDVWMEGMQSQKGENDLYNFFNLSHILLRTETFLFCFDIISVLAKIMTNDVFIVALPKKKGEIRKAEEEEWHLFVLHFLGHSIDASTSISFSFFTSFSLLSSCVACCILAQVRNHCKLSKIHRKKTKINKMNRRKEKQEIAFSESTTRRCCG